MQLGVYSFGSLARNPQTGVRATTAQAMRDLLEAIVLADEVGLDYFGIGEHHTEGAPASAAAVLLAGAATVTKRIRLGSAVTVLSTDDPVRVFQQFATVDALSGGRAEITAGRGSSTESYPLFGYDLADYDDLYGEKLDLLLRINDAPRVTWTGRFRPALTEAVIVPRPDSGRLPIWLGTGGSPESSVRAGQLGLPISYGIIGGDPARFAPLADLYRRAWDHFGHSGPGPGPRVSVATPGFIGEDDDSARESWWSGWRRVMTEVGQQRGFPAPERAHYTQEVRHGALLVGSPEDVARRIIDLHAALGHMRQFVQMDLGELSQRDYLRSIELLGTKVKPLVDAELPSEPAVLPG